MMGSQGSQYSRKLTPQEQRRMREGVDAIRQGSAVPKEVQAQRQARQLEASREDRRKDAWRTANKLAGLLGTIPEYRNMAGQVRDIRSQIEKDLDFI